MRRTRGPSYLTAVEIVFSRCVATVRQRKEGEYASGSLLAFSLECSENASLDKIPELSVPCRYSSIVRSAGSIIDSSCGVFFSDPSSILGGVRLPPDTEIIKYTSSIVGPKVPGTTNRGRKKTISLDTPSVSVHPPAVSALSAHQTNTTSSTSLMMEPRKYNRTGVRGITWNSKGIYRLSPSRLMLAVGDVTKRERDRQQDSMDVTPSRLLRVASPDGDA